MSNKQQYQIEELPDLMIGLTKAYKYQNVPLLDYVWEVANHFLPDYVETDQGMMSAESIAPALFVNRYFERNLSIRERYERAKKIGICNTSFEDYSNDHKKYRRLDDSFKEKFLTNEDLQNTINAFHLDISKFWYLLLFIYDFIEDLGINTPNFKKTTLEDFSCFYANLLSCTSITLRENNKKRYITEREDTISIIQIALQYFINTYSEIVHNKQNDRSTMLKKLKEIGMRGFIENNLPLNFIFSERDSLDISHKKWKFTDMFLFFLKNRKAYSIPNKKVKVSKDKMMFISRLIYTVGYDNKRYNNEYDSECNKNRMLSNLLRRYKKEKFPSVIAKNYNVISL